MVSRPEKSTRRSFDPRFSRPPDSTVGRNLLRPAGLAHPRSLGPHAACSTRLQHADRPHLHRLTHRGGCRWLPHGPAAHAALHSRAGRRLLPATWRCRSRQGRVSTSASPASTQRLHHARPGKGRKLATNGTSNDQAKFAWNRVIECFPQGDSNLSALMEAKAELAK
ncbi:MAG: hypothetical protein RIS79_187 [Verrucomicrobiota bacterium]